MAALLGVAAFVAVVGGAVLVHRTTDARRLAAALPDVPVNGVPEALVQRLLEAQAATFDRGRMSEGLATLGHLYHANGYVDEAEVCWRILMEHDPGNARWSYLLADLARLRSDYAAMDALLARTTDLDSSYAPAWLQRADLWFKTGNAGAAVEAYRRRLELLPGDPYARLGLARAARQEGREDEARALIEQLVVDEPAFAPAHNLFADILADAGDAAGAERQRAHGSASGRFRAAADPWLDELWNACFDYERLCAHGMREVLTGRVEEGIGWYQRALQLRPDAFPAYELLGNAYLDLQDSAKALACYEQAHQRASDAQSSPKFMAHLSRAYRLQNRPDDAVRVLRTALRNQPYAAELHDALGSALVDLGDVDGALRAHRTAFERAPGDASIHYNLVTALIAAHRLEEAVEELQQIYARSPEHPPTLALLAQIEMDSGRWQSALRYLEPLYHAQPDLPEATGKMAYARVRAGAEAEHAGDLRAAETHYRAALRLRTTDPELYGLLGSVLLQQRRPADAIAPLEACHRLEAGRGASSWLLGQAYAATGRLDDARRILRTGATLATSAGDTALAQRCEELLQRLP